MLRRVTLLALVGLVVAVMPVHAQTRTAFPPVRAGLGTGVNSGHGVVAGDSYIARSAVVAWNRRWNSLTLYLLSRSGVTCGSLLRAIARPGHLIQVYVTSKPQVSVGRPVAGAAVAFVTVSRNPKVPEQVSGLKHGAQLTFTRVDSYPRGVWSGVFRVPTRAYGDNKVYGYNGTFAARWCVLSH